MRREADLAFAISVVLVLDEFRDTADAAKDMACLQRTTATTVSSDSRTEFGAPTGPDW